MKAANAQAAGAAGLLVSNTEDGPFDGTLGDPKASAIPVAGNRAAFGRELAAAPNPVVEMVLDTRHAADDVRRTSSRTPSPRRPKRAHRRRPPRLGARSGPESTTTAPASPRLLEIARAVSQESRRALSVRFAFWGAEELGLFGSRAYARTVEREPGRGLPQLRRARLAVAPIRRLRRPRFVNRWLGYFSAAARRVGSTSRAARITPPFAQRGIPVAGSPRGTTPATTEPATASRTSTCTRSTRSPRRPPSASRRSRRSSR